MLLKKTKTRRLWPLLVSIFINILFILAWLFSYMNSPSNKLGVLTRDVNAGIFAGDSIIYRIPKGVTVKNVSPRGIAAIGQFENNRFEIVLTTNRPELVNYNIPKDSLSQFGNYYSADISAGMAR